MNLADLRRLHPCAEALAFVESQPDWRTAVERVRDPAWAEYERVCLVKAREIAREL